MIRRAKRFPTVLDTIGNTPLVQLINLPARTRCEVLAKLEYLNPGGSSKDRPLRAMVEEAESKGLLKPGGIIIDSSSGNFAVAMAMVGAARGYRVICVVDPNLTHVTRDLIRSLGAELEFVDNPDDSGSHLRSRLSRRDELVAQLDGAWCPDQYHNPTGVSAHFSGTGAEIVADVGGELDVLVVAAGTCSTITGCAQAVKQNIPSVRVVAVDAVGSQIFHDRVAHRSQKGVGSSLQAGELSNLDLSVIDEVRFVSDNDAFMTARTLARTEGILAGGSSGTALFGALTVARELPPGSRIATVLPDRLERYLNDHQSDDWMREHGFNVETTPQAVYQAVDEWSKNAEADPANWKRQIQRTIPIVDGRCSLHELTVAK